MNKAVFLDRDGVITQDPPHYAHKLSQLKLIPGSSKAISLLNKMGFLVIVVSNQSGVAKGYYKEEDVKIFNDAMERELNEGGALIDAIYYCPHHPESKIDLYRMECDCRKPEPGMLKQAQKDMDLDLKKSIMIGDKNSDIEAGKKVGCKTIMVLTGHGKEESEKPGEYDYIVDDLHSAVELILKEKW